MLDIAVADGTYGENNEGRQKAQGGPDDVGRIGCQLASEYPRSGYEPERNTKKKKEEIGHAAM